MISLRDVSKTYKLINGRKVVLDKVAYDFAPGVNVGILGRNGAGKSTLINIISGTETPDSGEIHKTARVSWPLGYSMGFNSGDAATNPRIEYPGLWDIPWVLTAS
ncbi:hypothetical protein FACS1894158_11440 [Betaproteobacteria bacterium]|nr:hypothetical protein FACS1894158_11440 [Betaproteobacteria bacterium]